MKTIFQITQSLMVMFMIMITFIITFTHILGGPRRPWSEESLIELILVQAMMLVVYAVAKLGVYACNTWAIQRIR